MREFVQPALGHGGTPLQGEVKAVEKRIVDVKNCSLTNLVNGVIDLLDYVRLLVCSDILVLYLAQK